MEPTPETAAASGSVVASAVPAFPLDYTEGEQRAEVEHTPAEAESTEIAGLRHFADDASLAPERVLPSPRALASLDGRAVLALVGMLHVAGLRRRERAPH